MREVRFFDYPRLYLDKKEILGRIFHETCSRGAYILQKDLEVFEGNLAAFTGVKHAIGCANATDGLEMLLAYPDLITRGDEIICSTHTMAATASAICQNGGTVVLSDTGSDGRLTAEKIAEKITSRTKGIVVTQINGMCCDMDRICDLAEIHGLFIVEDSAQALGASFRGRPAGSFGIGGVFSFYPAKVLGCFGDGGAIVTDLEDMADFLTLYRDHGRDDSGDVIISGRNSRLDNLQASFLDYFLTDYESVIQRRRQIARSYHEALRDCEFVQLPRHPDENDDYFDICQNFEIKAEYRDQLKAYLADQGIGTLIQWSGFPLHQTKLFASELQFPIADEYFKKCLLLPLNMFISDEDVSHICAEVIRFYRG